jgi:hypothetical protein
MRACSRLSISVGQVPVGFLERCQDQPSPFFLFDSERFEGSIGQPSQCDWCVIGLISSPCVSFSIGQSVTCKARTDIFDAAYIAFEWGILLEVSCKRKSGNEILLGKDIVAACQAARVI